MHCVCSQQDEASEGGGGGGGGSIWDLLRCGRMKKGHKFTMPKGERSEYTHTLLLFKFTTLADEITTGDALGFCSLTNGIFSEPAKAIGKPADPYFLYTYHISYLQFTIDVETVM